MSIDRVTKSLLAVVAGMLGVIVLRSAPAPEAAALAQPAPAAPAAAGRVQVSATPNGFLVFDESTGDVMRATTTAADGVGMSRVGTLRRNDRGQWEFIPGAPSGPRPGPGGAAAPAPAPDAAVAASTTRAQADLATLVAALGAFRLDTGRYPSTEEGLHSLVVQPSAVENWKGPYVKPSLPMDPWGNPYVYHFPGRADPKRPDLASFGPDRKEGGGDDLMGASTPVK